MRKGVTMAKISVPDFIKELDSYFAREDLRGAGECLLKWREKAAKSGDLSGELTVLNEMIGYYRQTKEEAEGLASVRDAFVLITRLGIENKLSSATVYLNGATTMKAFGKSAQAMEYYERTEKIYKENLPEEHPLTAGLYNNMALALEDIGDNEKAERYFRKAIAITEKIEKNELETAVSCINLAHLLYKKDIENEEINPLMERALDILENPDYFGYQRYAFTCRKSAPSFGFFGFFAAEKALNERADRIYAGS